MTEKRPDPDALLHQVQEEERQESRGKLKIYLGAAPGVGKTYSMLHDALKERSQGLDVVIGVVESHGRQEIEEILKDFESLDRVTVEYHGKQLLEFDIDAVLKRQPGLILIDEMAHTNAPGMRHKKRWQDIKELLDRGIDIYTTLNVQHIESLNDDVSQIIHAPVRETVPDSMIEMADTIELVDLPPEALLKRLSEGKVYVPAQAEIAATSFFRKGNLIALRELALRAVARRVNAQVLLYRQGQGIKQIWPTVEKILVCVGSGPESLKLIRAAKRMVTSFHAEWIAVYVDKFSLGSYEERRSQAIQHLRFAEQLGAQTRIISGFEIVKEVMAFAREQNVTQIMIWKHAKWRWKDIFFPNLAHEFLRHCGDIDVYIMTGERQKKSEKKIRDKQSGAWQSYLLSISIVLLTTVIDFFLYPYLSSSSLIMVYLLGMTSVALLGSVGPSVLGTILSVVAYDFFFISPIYSFSFKNKESFFTLVVMFIVAQVISQLTLMIRHQTAAARLNESQISALYTLSRQLSSRRGIDKLLDLGIHYISDLFDSKIIALLPHNEHLMIRARCKTNQELDSKELGIAQWVYELGQKAGLGTDSLPFSNALYIPLLGSQEVIGVLRIHPRKAENLDSPEKINLLEACVNQIALALEVDGLHDMKKSSELQTEKDRARSSLLKSISRDLRAPLLVITGAASTQIEMAKTLDVRAIRKIGKDIYFEAEQLSRLINNLLQITYLESEAITLQKQLLSLKDLIDLIVQSSTKKLGKRSIKIIVPDDLPLVPFDSSLIQEVFLNLLDNAVKFTPSDSPIEISVLREKNKVVVSIKDRGPGIVLDEVNQLFEKYYRGRMLTSERGLGLGLAICRIIIEAHGGKIWAENREEGGAVFRFTLPLVG